METNQDKLRAELKEVFKSPNMRAFAVANKLDPSWFHGWMNNTKNAGLVTLEKINNGIKKLRS